MTTSPSTSTTGIRLHGQTAAVGALAGAGLGWFEQLFSHFPSDVTVAALGEEMPRFIEGAVIGAPLWAALAVVLGLVSDWSRRSATARLVRWTAGSLGTALVALVALWSLARFGRGYSRDFALFHALAFTAPGMFGVWLGGALRRA